ncbi:MAG: HmuY family protein [Chitinophagaceae bacterium]|nr:HmuY family protein [Oligoflexus sp.]
MKTLITIYSVLILNTVACGHSPKSSADKTAMAATGTADIVDTSTKFEVDATNKEAWTYFDLDTGTVVIETDSTWDLAFKRTAIKMNGPTVSALNLGVGDFNSILTAPADPFASDTGVPGATSETNGLFFHAGDAWYSYNPETHVISSRVFNYIVKTNGGKEFKLNILGYYNADHLPAYVELKYQELAITALATRSTRTGE